MLQQNYYTQRIVLFKQIKDQKYKGYILSKRLLEFIIYATSCTLNKSKMVGIVKWLHVYLLLFSALHLFSQTIIIFVVKHLLLLFTWLIHVIRNPKLQKNITHDEDMINKKYHEKGFMYYVLENDVSVLYRRIKQFRF